VDAQDVSSPVSRRRYGARRRRSALDLYRSGRSLEQVAVELGVSVSWVYGIVAKGGEMRNVSPSWSAALIPRTLELYLEQRLSCRAVAEQLARELDGDGPSHEWVATRLRERGLLRDKSASQRARRKVQARRDYTVLEEGARGLYRQGFGVPAIAKRLDVSRRSVKRWTADLRRDPATAQRAKKWTAPTEDVRQRLRRRALVVELRQTGATYAAIVAATGVSKPTVYLYLRAAGLVRAQPNRRRKRSRPLPGAPDERRVGS